MRYEIHHKDGNVLNNSISNLEVICPHCHRRAHPLNVYKNIPKEDVCIKAVFSPEFRLRLLERFNFRCNRCGTDLRRRRKTPKETEQELTLDEIMNSLG